MSTFRAFQTGLMAGQEQAKVKREDDARMKASDEFGKGNYEGAVSSLMGVGLMQDADAYTKAGERAKEKERTETYANAYKTGLGAGPAPPVGANASKDGLVAGPAPNPRGGYSAVRDAAMGAGDIDTATQMEKFIATADDQTKAAFTESMEFLGSTAIDLKTLPPEARGPAAMEILQKSPFNNPQITAMIEKAAADGKLTDQELDAFAMQTMSAADRVKHTLDQSKATEAARHNRAMEQKQGGNGIKLQFGAGGGLSNLSIGGTGTDGKEPAIVRGPDGQPVVTPGQQQLVANKDWQRLQSSEQKTNLVLDDIRRAKDMIGPWTTGAAASLKDLPIFGQSTEAGRLGNLLKTIRANVGFDELQQMRQESPTGGALGQVAVQEIEFLQSVLGSLEQAQRPEDVSYNIKRLEDYLNQRGEKRRKAFAQDYPDLAEFAGFAAGAQREGARSGVANQIAPGTVEDGYRFKGGNPGNPNSWEPVQ